MTNAGWPATWPAEHAGLSRYYCCSHAHHRLWPLPAMHEGAMWCTIDLKPALSLCLDPGKLCCVAGVEIKMPSIGGSLWETLSLLHAAERQAAMGGTMDFKSALSLRLDVMKPSQATIQEFLAAHPHRLSKGKGCSERIRADV
eukprot:1138644-Pelagomonas_calceolata.AAC.5